MRNAALLLMWVISLFCSGSVYASINTTPLIASSSTINTGQIVTFDISISDFLTSGYNSEYVTTIDYLFNSGDGQTSSGSYSVNQYTPSNILFSSSFSYLNAGNFTPEFSATVYATDTYIAYVYQQTGGYWYHCGFSSCYQPTYGYVPITYSSNLSFGANSNTSLTVSTVSAVPEPETYAMLLSGLGLIGFMAYRRKGSSTNLQTAA
jgi:hypothetical protein